MRSLPIAAFLLGILWCTGVFVQKPNVPMPTLGGFQIWADETVHAGWRVQRKALSD